MSSKKAAPPAGRPIVIANQIGLPAAALAMQMILQGSDALDAVIAGVNTVEDDPSEHSVGLGGLPNSAGVVELDAAVMHGPTRRGGAVAALQGIRHPASVARLVMELTDHVMLVGNGALEFARAQGFQEENLLTKEARSKWTQWKRDSKKLGPSAAYRHTHAEPGPRRRPSPARKFGTMNCLGRDLRGNLSGCVSTSGLSFKLPGRVSDSAVLGAGLWVDNDIGAAGCTGFGEASILTAGSFYTVDCMRCGMLPQDACLEACQRAVETIKEKRFLDRKGRLMFNVKYHAINKAGEFGCAAVWSDAPFVINTGAGESRLLNGAYLYRRPGRRK
jgi:N4-(beta-N-acetylglucosaminyl)-L-asparaginase